MDIRLKRGIGATNIGVILTNPACLKLLASKTDDAGAPQDGPHTSWLRCHPQSYVQLRYDSYCAAKDGELNLTIS